MQHRQDIKDRYDVVIIGAGIGGLSAGALLAKAGKNVLILEKRDHPGGLCSSFRHKGFAFDAGFSFLSGGEDEGDIAELLRSLDLRSKIEWMELPAAFTALGDDFRLPLLPFPGHRDKWIAAFPKEVEAIESFAATCRNLRLETRALDASHPDQRNLLGKLQATSRFLFRSPTLRRLKEKAFPRAIEEILGTSSLSAFVGAQIPPNEGAAILRLWGIERFQYPKNGFQELADVLAEGLSRNGGTLKSGTRVEKILLEKKAAVAVKLEDGSIVRARHIVSNADDHSTFLEMAGGQFLPRSLKKQWMQPTSEGYGLMVSLGLNMDLADEGFPYHACRLIPDDGSGSSHVGGLHMRAHSLRDPSQAPSGKSTLQIFGILPGESLGDLKSDGIALRSLSDTGMIERISGQWIDESEVIVPGLTESIEVKETSVLKWRNRSSLEGTSFAGRSQTVKSPIPNLFRVREDAYPQIGLFMLGNSPRAAAQLVLEG